MGAWFDTFKDKFYNDFIKDDRWRYLWEGLGVTLQITFFAIIIGIVLGFIIAVIRSTHDMTGKMKVGNAICKFYLTIFRGTPVVVQLMIIYFVIFAAVDIDKTFVAVIAFGLNSAAYVAEIFRSGIMSHRQGPVRSRAAAWASTTSTHYAVSVIMPQAFKNVLPALANEFIVLLKETSVSGYMALQDLTKAGDIIQQPHLFDPLLPLIAVALIYLILVVVLLGPCCAGWKGGCATVTTDVLIEVAGPAEVVSATIHALDGVNARNPSEAKSSSSSGRPAPANRLSCAA